MNQVKKNEPNFMNMSQTIQEFKIKEISDLRINNWPLGLDKANFHPQQRNYS